MNHKQQGFIRRSLIVGAAVSVIGTASYFTFRRTLIADVREAVMQVDTTDPMAYGATLFQTRGCVGCHQLDSAGATGDEGPNLSGIGSREHIDYLRESIVSPNAVIADACPEGECQANLMPPYGQILTDTQVDALVVYLAAQR